MMAPILPLLTIAAWMPLAHAFAPSSHPLAHRDRTRGGGRGRMRPPPSTMVATDEDAVGDGVAALVEVRETAERGRGVFATARIANGTFIGRYGGDDAERIDYDELLKRYPNLEVTTCFPNSRVWRGVMMKPEYCFELSDDAFVDAINSAHFTRFINHDGTERANVGFDIVRRAPATAGAWVSTAADASVEFCAIADIAPGEELLFDYGAQYWDGRSSTPLDGTDARLYADAADAPLVGLPVPLSRGAVREVLADRDAPDAEKRAALMRALDYFGVPADAVRVPPPWWRVGGRGAASEPATRPYAELSARELARALRTVLRAADDADGKKI